jgi:lipopolysaccharide export system permease protein
MTILDRYLLRRYVHVFLITYLALFGLYFVIDAFTNINDFLDTPGGTLEMMSEIGRFYSYRACYFFGLIGGTVAVIAGMTVLALILKHGELNPILSAGVPTSRLTWPLVTGVLLVNAALNQEFVVPQIATQLQMNAGARTHVTGEVEPVYDFATDILITGKRLNLAERKIEDAEFVLKAPQLAEKLTTIHAREAIPHEHRARRRNGWLLKGVSIRYQSLQLTDRGRKFVLVESNPEDLFIRSDVAFDRLYLSDRNYEYLSTRELVRRIHSPSYSSLSVTTQCQYLHTRFTKPLLNVFVVLIGVPFVLRRESTSLITNLGVCAGVMGLVLGVTELFSYLGRANVIRADLSAWGPIIICGTARAWLKDWVRT